eukprot:gnl/MRDRNA2_/MRDRNA2_123336_c0_seq1.p1 gnl/MRDRNA2_/MRDRNA2_123336_c0~~gnl/MRDRNA2_/MRDRNA2_123336_c0_seq1.p1  ORF type:complete len:1073 (+),score=177.21 gnl/MRDRNA2_/MRDRNA2_123336_c0_seq1:183-3221(+)
MATHDGQLRVFVNELERFSFQIFGLDGSAELYPIVELCGTAREVLLEPFPVVPASLKNDGGLAMLRQKTYQLSRWAIEPYSDLWACGIIARLCFSTNDSPESRMKPPPNAFLQLLASAQRWMEGGRQALETRGDFLKALWDWFDLDKSDMLADVQPGVASVLQRVYCSNGQHHGTRMTADEFRCALNAETAWSHMSPEFLISHLTALGVPAMEAAGGGLGVQSKGNPNASTKTARKKAKLKPKSEVVWDLSPWTLSASHIRRVVKILQSDVGKQMDVVNVMRFEAKIPSDLVMLLVDCLRLPVGTDGVDAENEQKPSLQFGAVRLPLDDCRIPFQDICEVNATGIVLRFVQRLNLSRGPEDSHPAMGPSGAVLIADALYKNRALLELNLRGQLIGQEGARALGGALQANVILKKLDLSCNSLGPGGMQELSEALCSDGVMLDVLEVSMNGIGDEGCQYISQMLQDNSVLTTLVLQRNEIGPIGAIALGCALLRNDTLEILDVGRNDIDSQGAGSLLRVGRSNVSLTCLNLQDNNLDLIAAEKLADALAAPDAKPSEPNMNHRQSTFGPRMTMSNGSVVRDRRGTIGSQAGSQSTAPRATIKGPPSFDDVEASQSASKQSNSRQSEITGKLPVLEENEDVDLLERKRRRTTVIDSNAFELKPHLRNLTVRHQSTVREIPLWNTIRRLNLRRNNLGSEGAVRLFLVLKNNNRMIAVNIAWNGLGRIAARAWAELFTPQSRCMVEEWDLRDNFLGDEAAIGQFLANVAKSSPAASQPSSMRWLNLANNRLDDQGLQYLAEAMPMFTGLEVLLLYNNPDLCCTRSGKWRAESNVAIKKGSQNSAGEFRGISSLSKALGQSLRVLCLGSCGLGDDGVAAACRPLVGHPSLVEVDLSDNGIGQQTGNKVPHTLCDLMRSTRSLKQLCLALNVIGDDMAMKFLQCLCVDAPGLEQLDLCANVVSQDLRVKVSEKIKAEEVASARGETNLQNALERPEQTSLEAAGLFTAVYPLGNRVCF